MKLAIGSSSLFHCITAVPHEYMLWVDNSRSQASTLIILALQVVMSAPAAATCRLSNFVVRKTREAETGVRDIVRDHFHLYILLIRLQLLIN